MAKCESGMFWDGGGCVLRPKVVVELSGGVLNANVGEDLMIFKTMLEKVAFTDMLSHDSLEQLAVAGRVDESELSDQEMRRLLEYARLRRMRE